MESLFHYLNTQSKIIELFLNYKTMERLYYLKVKILVSVNLANFCKPLELLSRKQLHFRYINSSCKLFVFGNKKYHLTEKHLFYLIFVNTDFVLFSITQNSINP